MGGTGARGEGRKAQRVKDTAWPQAQREEAEEQREDRRSGK